MQGRITGLLLSLIALAVPAFAQDDGAAPQADSAPAADDANAAERDDLEPGVSTSGLAADVQRSTRGERVMDEMDLSRSEITGNQELPKVLYIVPWQKADPGELMGKPVNTLLDEVLAPIDRSEFIRQVDYYDDLNRRQEE
ncbi:MAG TPA: hypothetical protein VKQ06_11570 [Gammaproteobacteria bacterium]|nr:hypothetical protein [Gammaproteobacteria bacterium]HZW59196.1 hypothetical protein [Woeseiaceae bacterium]